MCLMMNGHWNTRLVVGGAGTTQFAGQFGLHIAPNIVDSRFPIPDDQVT